MFFNYRFLKERDGIDFTETILPQLHSIIRECLMGIKEVLTVMNSPAFFLITPQLFFPIPFLLIFHACSQFLSNVPDNNAMFNVMTRCIYTMTVYRTPLLALSLLVTSLITTRCLMG